MTVLPILLLVLCKSVLMFIVVMEEQVGVMLQTTDNYTILVPAVTHSVYTMSYL